MSNWRCWLSYAPDAPRPSVSFVILVLDCRRASMCLICIKMDCWSTSDLGCWHSTLSLMVCSQSSSCLIFSVTSYSW